MNGDARAYSTKEIADAARVHVNTVRFYEEIGFLTKPDRRPNGYRVWTGLQLAQCGLIRLAMRAEVLQGGLRRQAAEIVRLCAARDWDASLAAARAYRALIDAEVGNARAAAAFVERAVGRGGGASFADGVPQTRPAATPLSRRDAARALRVTPETLRTWERNGLISIGRRVNGYRAYSAADMERLNVVRTLRGAGYSLSAILRLLTRLDARGTASVETILDTPAPDEDILTACDHLIQALRAAAADAAEIERQVAEIRADFETLQ